jgi:hypothetical protein
MDAALPRVQPHRKDGFVVGLPCETFRPSTPWLCGPYCVEFRHAGPFKPSSHQYARMVIFVPLGFAPT